MKLYPPSKIVVILYCRAIEISVFWNRAFWTQNAIAHITGQNLSDLIVSPQRALERRILLVDALFGRVFLLFCERYFYC
jgi:hypothetical protein